MRRQRAKSSVPGIRKDCFENTSSVCTLQPSSSPLSDVILQGRLNCLQANLCFHQPHKLGYKSATVKAYFMFPFCKGKLQVKVNESSTEIRIQLLLCFSPLKSLLCGLCSIDFAPPLILFYFWEIWTVNSGESLESNMLGFLVFIGKGDLSLEDSEHITIQLTSNCGISIIQRTFLEG